MGHLFPELQNFCPKKRFLTTTKKAVTKLFLRRTKRDKEKMITKNENLHPFIHGALSDVFEVIVQIENSIFNLHNYKNIIWIF